jgi:3-oxoacyl-[acyl-carrier protein] reductase
MVSETPVALITGASRGIGRAISLALAADGYDIAAVARPGTQAADTVTRQGRHCLAIEADVSRLDGHDGILGRVCERFGRLDLLVSNAGIAPERRLDVLETTPESFDHVLGTNLRGAFFLAQKAIRIMLECRLSVPRSQPRVVFIGSVSAEASSPNRAEYCISKAGLAMAARVLADRLAPAGIPVFEVRPGIIRTDMTAPVQARYDSAIAAGLVPQRRWGDPEDVARAVVALARGALDYSTGMIIDVSGGMTLPRL